MAKVKNEHYITIQEFMVNDLELSGNELIAYALIYGFSQDGESYFKGSLSYVAKWLNCSKATACTILNKLAEDGFLEKKEKNVNGVRLCDYTAYPIDEKVLKEIKEKKKERKEKEKAERYAKKLNTPSKNHKGYSKNLNGRSKNLNGSIQKTLIHNTTDILDDVKDENIDDNTTKDKTLSNDNVEVKTSFSENQKKMSPPKSNLQKYLDKKADEQDMLKRLARICIENYDKPEAVEIYDTIQHYFDRYTQKTGLIHPILKDETLLRMTEKMDCFYDSEYSHFERLIGQDHAFMKMVDMFFDGDFGANSGNETNYNLPAFMTDGVLNPLGQRLFELGEVE